MRAVRVGNRERIIEASLELFNAQGTHRVTTNHIAAHLSISPGNLYYHFGNKEEIIRALFPQFAEAVSAAVIVPEDRDLTAADVGRSHVAGIETLWDYRFVFRDLNELLARDEELAEAYRELRRWVVDRFIGIFERLIAQGYMRRPDPPDDLARVAANGFILWSTWVNHVMNLRGELDVEPSDVVDGALQSFLTFSPYLEKPFAAEVRAVFHKSRGG